MKKSSLLLAVFSCLVLAAAPKPLSIGGYSYDRKTMQTEVCSKNKWVCKIGTVPVAEFKDYSAIYIGNMIKYEKVKPLLDTEEARKQLIDYLNAGGTLIVNCHIPRDMMGKNDFHH